MRKMKRGLSRRQLDRTGVSGEDAKIENRLIAVMAMLGVLFMVGYHSLAQSSLNGGSSGSGSCGSSAPSAQTPSLGGGYQGVLNVIGRGLGGPENILGATLTGAVVSDQAAGDIDDSWRIIDTVFPFGGSPEQNPHSFVYQFQVQVSSTLEPGGSVYLGGICIHNKTETQQTNSELLTVFLHTDEVLELKVSMGLRNDARAEVLGYEYVGFQTCAGENAGGACGEYGLRAHHGAVNVSLAIGMASQTNKRSGVKGTLRIFSQEPTAALAHPSLLCYASQPDSDVEVIRETAWDGAIRQIKGADGVLEVRRDEGRGFTLLHFPPDAVGERDANGLYATTDLPYATWTIRIGTVTDPTSFQNLEIQERVGASAASGEGVRHRYVWSEADQGWDLILGDGLVGDRSRVSWDNDRRVKRVTREQYDPASGKLDRRYVTVFTKLIDGEETLFKTQEIANPGPNEKVTSYDYGMVPGQAGFRQLSQVVDANGGWVRYAYDDDDRVIRRWSGFLNQKPTDDWRKCRMIQYDYQPLLKSRDDGSQPGVARTEIVTTLGKETSRVYRVISGNTTTTYRSSKPGFDWDEKRTAVTRHETFGAGDFEGHLKSIMDPRGRLTTFEYRLQDDRFISVQRSGISNKSGNQVVKGIETTQVKRRDGALLSERQVDIETGILIEETQYRDHDRLGRAQRIDYADGSYELAMRSDCCGIDFERKRDGTQISYSRDALGRVTSKLTGEQEERFVYDCAGEVLEWSLVDLTEAASPKFRKETRNLAGELEVREDASGKRLFQSTSARATFTGLPGALLDSPLEEDELSGWQEIETQPDGSTIVRTYAADGRLLILSGTAVHGLNYEYGVEEDQGLWRAYTRTTNLMPDGGETQESVTVFEDSLGHVYRTVYAGGAEERRFYGLDGQLVKSVDPDGVTSLYESDLLGNVQTSVIDMNRNGKIDWKGKDHISQSVRDYIIQEGKPATRIESFVWTEDGKDRATRRSTRIQSSDGLDVWQTRWLDRKKGATVHTQRRIQDDGREVETTTQADGSRTELVTFQSRIQSTTQLDAAGNTISRIDYEYNPLGQLIASTDRRTGTTNYEYDEQGNRVRVLSPAPHDGAARPETRFRYDQMNRIIQTIHPDGGSVYTEYWATGEKKFERGVRTYPVRYDYDYAGRLRTMATWQDYSGEQGRAETIWERDNQGQMVHKKYADGLGPRYTYTPAGRLASRIWARGIVTEYDYDAAGRLEKTSYSDKTSKIERKYDRTGQLVEVKSGKRTTKLSYDSWGLLIREEGKGSNKFDLKRQYDKFGRPLGYQLKQGKHTAQSRYEYDSAGRIVGVSDGEVYARYDYLPGSHMVSKLAIGSEQQPEQMVSTKSYDRLNRLTTIHHRTPKGVMASFDYTYNQANQRVEVRREDHSLWRYEYDRFGQVIFGGKFAPNAENGNLEAIPGHGFHYGFDDIGNRRQSTRLDTPFNSSGPAVGARSDYSVNLLNQNEGRTVPPIADLIGETDPRADLLVRAENENGESRPVDIERAGSQFRALAKVDNRQSAPTTTFEVEATLDGSSNTRSATVTTPASPVTYTHDPDGNLIQDESWHYVWNGENRLVTMYSHQNVAPEKRKRLDFNYDYQGRRIEKVKSAWDRKSERYKQTDRTVYLYDSWNLISEISDKGKDSHLKSYLWGMDLSHSFQKAGGVGGLLVVGLNEGAAKNDRRKSISGCRFPFYDGNGNVAGLTENESGELLAHYTYGPFGEQLRTSGPDGASNAFRFSTKYQDEETGLYYYGMRYFNPTTGVWMSNDPIGEYGGKNLYCFVKNNPASLVDILGLLGNQPRRVRCSRNEIQEDREGYDRCYSGQWDSYQRDLSALTAAYDLTIAAIDDAETRQKKGCESQFNSCSYSYQALVYTCKRLVSAAALLNATAAYSTFQASRAAFELAFFGGVEYCKSLFPCHDGYKIVSGSVGR